MEIDRNTNSFNLSSSLNTRSPLNIRLLHLLVVVILLGQWQMTYLRSVQAAGPVQLVRYPYLQQLSTDTVTVVWTTTESGPSGLRYSTDLSFSNVVSAPSTFKSVSAPAPYDDYYEHVAVLTNLTPDTIYNYAIYTQGVELATDNQLNFKTNPGSDTCVFNFAMLGDTGVDRLVTQTVRDLALARGFDFAVNAGDVAYNSGTYEELELNFFNLYQGILWNQMMWPSIGNHEYSTNSAAPYLDVFHLPEQALRSADHERYYSFDYGNAHFIVLDTNDPLRNISDGASDDMADWLEADLIANDSFWTIVVMHHPWYVSDDRSHPTLIHTLLVPLFEAYGVDIALTGHDHLYERTFPIKADSLSTVSDGGVVYVTNGEGGGKTTTGYDFVDPAPNWSASRSDNYGSYTHIYVDSGLMSLITIDEGGNIVDGNGNNPVIIIDRTNEPGSSCKASVSGTVYEDTDGDRAFSAGDMPLEGVQINLSNGQSVTTNASGFYQFANLMPGNYTITEIDPPGYISVLDVDGANDNLISTSVTVGDNIVEQNFLDKDSSNNSGDILVYLPVIIK